MSQINEYSSYNTSLLVVYVHRYFILKMCMVSGMCLC